VTHLSKGRAGEGQLREESKETEEEEEEGEEEDGLSSFPSLYLPV
jgi:hypothetical protein